MSSKYMRFKIDLKTKEEKNYKTQIQKLKQELYICETLNRGVNDSGDTMGVSMNAKVTAESFDMLPIIAKHNIKLAFYLFLCGVDQHVGMDMDKYKYVNDHVNYLGETKAREELLKML